MERKMKAMKKKTDKEKGRAKGKESKVRQR